MSNGRVIAKGRIRCVVVADVIPGDTNLVGDVVRGVYDEGDGYLISLRTPDGEAHAHLYSYDQEFMIAP